MKKYNLLILFALGVVYRLILAKLVPQPFIFDQTEYHQFAVGIINQGLTVWPTRLYGYPLFLAIVYKLFGTGNFLAVTVIQAILDCLTAVIIYKSAEIIFKDKTTAIISYFLYLVNPFTAAFT